jgi:prephenate dehydratase
MGLHRVCKRVVFLGSYPRADGKEPKVPYGGRDSDYQAALDWLRQVSPEIPRLPYDRT